MTKKRNGSIASRTGERETDRELLALVRTLIGEPDLKEITPAVLERVKTRLAQAHWPNRMAIDGKR